MPTTEDLRFVSRIGEVASAGDADDFGSSEYHTGLGSPYRFWLLGGVGTHPASVSSGEKEVFIRWMRQTLAVRRESTIQLPSKSAALFYYVSSYLYAARRQKVDLRPYPAKIRLEGKLPIGATAKHENRGFESQPSSRLTTSEWKQLVLLLHKANPSGHISDEVLAHLRAVQLDARSEQEGTHALHPVLLGNRRLLDLPEVAPGHLLASQPDARSEHEGNLASPRPQVTPTEEFQGFVEKIEDDKAYVRLDTSRGERLCGPYPAEELASKGIGERDRFLLRAVEVGGAIRFDAELIPRKIITPERQRQIREEIEAGLEGFTPDDER